MLRLAILLLPIFFLVSCQTYVSQIKTAYKFEERKLKLKEGINKTSKDFGLIPLTNESLANGYIEIRFYRFGSGYIVPVYKELGVKKSVLILKLINSEWSATAIRDTVELKENSQRIEKRISEELCPATASWENLFQQLVDEEILTVSPDQDEGIYPDATLYVIETKINQNYRLAYSQIPNEAAEEKGSKQIAKLFNLVFKEFGASDFQAPTKLFE